jgi:predicted cupin superfamily sugar epimerase
MQAAESVVATLQLVPHPEGGWYRETWRAAGEGGTRSPGTAILYLLEAGCRSHWHRVDADEMWLWHAGAPLDLLIADANDTNPARITLGGDVTRGYTPQALVPATRWQAAEARDGWALVSCVVVPGFDFAGFEMAPAGWAP